jgi:hypothetical protein
VHDEIAVIRQEAHLVADVPDHLIEILARFTRALRHSQSVDQRSGVSARFAIAGAETIAAAALHRATAQGEDHAVARVVDLQTAVDVLGGKIEFETGEEGREEEILTHLLRTSTAEVVRARLAGLDLGLLVDALESGAMVTTGDQVTARDFLAGLPVLGESELYDDICDRLDATNDGERAGAIELALEGLYLARRWTSPRRSSTSARTSWPATRRSGRCRSSCVAAVVSSRASTTSPDGSRRSAATCSSGTGSTAPSRRSASCSTGPCSRSASSWPATSTSTTGTAPSARSSWTTCRRRRRRR